jgi:hypothetical protein
LEGRKEIRKEKKDKRKKERKKEGRKEIKNVLSCRVAKTHYRCCVLSHWCVICGFRCGVNEIGTFWGLHAA